MSWTCFEESTPVARKDHRCSWCGQRIPQSTRYDYSRGVWEGRIVTNKMHPECSEAAAEDYRMYGEGFTPYDNVRPKVSANGSGT